MSRLLILGAGQYGYVAKEVAEAMGIYSQIDFLDDHCPSAIGKLRDMESIEHDAVFVAIGAPAVRSQWLQRIEKLVTLIHPRAAVSPSASIGAGSIIEAGAVVSAHAKIGKGTIIMANAVVGHDAAVGDCCQVKYNSTIPENCIVPDCTKVDCNVMYRDRAAAEEKNRQFIEEEREKNGAEPSFF